MVHDGSLCSGLRRRQVLGASCRCGQHGLQTAGVRREMSQPAVGAARACGAHSWLRDLIDASLGELHTCRGVSA